MECTTFPNAATQQRLRDVIGQAAQILARAGSESAQLDAEVLLGHALAVAREQLIVMADLPLGAAHGARFLSLLARRVQREPVGYIVGRQEFWSLDFHVTRDVLIPRPETERLIEVALRLAGPLRSDNPLRVLDIGTGSGAVAVTMAKELPSARIYATDISPSALAIARKNAALNGVDARITFLCGDLFAALADQTAPFDFHLTPPLEAGTIKWGFQRGRASHLQYLNWQRGSKPPFANSIDLIVSNPPYLRSAEIVGLEPEVCQWEPRLALDGGVDGLDFYRRIAAQAGRFLAPNGAIALEIGADMSAEVVAILTRCRLYRDVQIVRDYGGQDRVVSARVATDLDFPNQVKIANGVWTPLATKGDARPLWKPHLIVPASRGGV
ncbi:MAG: N5-glutamine methyltransferase family protein [Candidatus Binatia bacterium]